MGFEPTKGVTLYTLSKRAPSTTRTPLRKTDLNCESVVACQVAGVQGSEVSSSSEFV